MQPMTCGTPGVVTSLVTPFSFHPDATNGGSVQVHERSWRDAIIFQRDSGIAAVAVAGRIGEGFALSRRERKRLVETAAEVSGPMLILADVSSDDPGWSETFAIDAEAAGARGVVVRTPSYSRANFAAVRRHVERVKLAVDVPVHVELDLSGTRSGMTFGEVSKLVRIDGVAGLIGHSSDPLKFGRLGDMGKRTSFLSADEPSCVASRMFGADGFFSAIANCLPADVLRMQAACCEGEYDQARSIHERLLPLMLVVRDHGIVALKYALLVMRGIECTVRAPINPLERGGRIRVEEALSALVLQGIDVRPPFVARPVAETVDRGSCLALPRGRARDEVR